MAETLEDEIVTATMASRAFSELLHRVCYGGESFAIKKGQRLMARLVPVVETDVKPAEEVTQPSTIMGTLESTTESEPEPTTGDEAEFYRAWMEQVRKVEIDI